MTGFILIAYSTKHGSTREVAERIAEVIRSGGTDCRARPAREVGDLVGCSLVVVGAPIYNGRWLRDARRFLKRNRADLHSVPVAVFALGPRSTEPEAWARSRAQFDKALVRLPWLSPVSVRLFGGADPAGQRTRWRDVRDWEAIEAWGREILQSHTSPQSTSPAHAPRQDDGP